MLISYGFRNWALLNADVVRVAEKLKGIVYKLVKMFCNHCRACL